MRVALFTPLIAGLALAAMTLTALADITGGYFVYGRNPDGSAYDGTLQITEMAGGEYQVSWQVGSSYSGVGELKGDVLTVDWGGAHPAVYVVMPDGELHGTWEDGLGLELLTRTPR